MSRKEQKIRTGRPGLTVLRDLAAVTACKAVRAGLRLLGRGGTALPGQAALLLSPKALESAAEGMHIFVVTGTNGKTTTASILTQALRESGREVLTNSSGANLLSGITAEFACDTDRYGKSRRRWAVVECDEGALRQVVPLLHPDVILVTNLFRDQLDRYGEVMHTLDKIRAGILAADPGGACTVCLNADDSLVASLAALLAMSREGISREGVSWEVSAQPAEPRKVPREAGAASTPGKFQIRRFGLGPLTAKTVKTTKAAAMGVAATGATAATRATAENEEEAGQEQANENADAQYCIRCGARYAYRYHTFAHLGGFYCPECGYERARPETEVTEILDADADSTTVRLRTDDAEQSVRIGLPALYNVYNAAGAVCAWQAMGLPAEEILGILPFVEGSFGRMERFEVSGRQVRMILAKNPAGCDQALAYLKGFAEPFRLVLGLNDRTADGHDISWIWDADFERIAADPKITECLVTGDRAEDMCLRMVYAGMPVGKIRMVKEEKELVERIEAEGSLEEDCGRPEEPAAQPEPVLILLNYTAMLQLREVLRRRSGKGAFWENGGHQDQKHKETAGGSSGSRGRKGGTV